MSNILFSCWKGKVVDNRGKKPEEFETPDNIPAEILEDQEKKAVMDMNGFVVKSPDVSIVDLCVDFMERAHPRSCGKCIPCRIGTRVMLDILRDIAEGKGKKGDLKTLESLGESLTVVTKCKIGHTVPAPVLDAMKYYGDDFRKALEGKKSGGKR